MSLDETLKRLAAMADAHDRNWATLEKTIEAAVDRVLERRQASALVPFHAIKGGTPDAARMWLRRHPEVAALGVRVGNRLMFPRDLTIAALKSGGK